MIRSAAPETGPRPAALTIRDGSADDLDGVMRIMESAFPRQFGEAWTRSQCAGILPMSGVSLRIAADDQQALGFSLLRVVADEAELLLIGVGAGAQRRGIGRSLLEDFIGLAQGAGATRLHLEVRDGNPAIKLYEARGFAPAGRRSGYYRGVDGDLRDALTLVLQG